MTADLDVKNQEKLENDSKKYETNKHVQYTPLYKSQDFGLWVTSLLFFVVLGGAIFGLGYWRNWDAKSGYYHNVSATSSERFLPEPFEEEAGVKGRYGPGASARWYYWKQPPANVTWKARLFVWTCYLIHQFSVWMVIYWAQRKQAQQEKITYTTNVRWYNIALMVMNMVFHALHLLQTHLTYDALAQDTSITSSQGSVVVMLIFICVLEYRDRGLVFGWPSQYNTDKVSNTLRLPYSSMYLVRKYHGYGFAWAAIYTMWYHPMENTVGHIMGFFHTYIILIQGSLIFTRFHLNKYWRFLLESWVAIHATVVAIQTGGPDQMGTRLWPMFCFGFFTFVCVTQLFGLPFWRRLHVAIRFVPITILAAVIVGMYSWIPDKEGRPWTRMYEVVFIPSILLLFPIVVFAVLHLFLKIESCFEKSKRPKSTLLQGFFLFLGLASLLCCVLVGFLFQYCDVAMDGTVLQMFVYPIYTLFICFEIIFIKQAVNRPMLTKDSEKKADVIPIDNDITT